MKISKSKKELARIISENGGWRDGAQFSAQDKDGEVFHYAAKPTIGAGREVWSHKGCIGEGEFTAEKLPNWHQTILSRAEYFHLYPAPDADGWIEWEGGECPVNGDELVVCKVRSGREWRDGKAIMEKVLRWRHTGGIADIIAYRLHKPEQARPEFCESVMRSIPEPEIHSKNTALTQVDDIDVVESKPTIEQLAAEYRNRKDFAERKQQEADAAKADAEAKLAELIAAGKEVGLVLSVAAPEPELVITDWRDLRVGDIIECVDGRNKDRVGMVGRIDGFDLYNTDTDRPVRMVSDNGQVCWPTKWRFIRRP